MGVCSWCHKPTNKLARCSSLGNEYSVCMECARAYKKKVCRICGTPLGDTGIEGCCVMCAQRDYYEHKKAADTSEDELSCSGEPMSEDSFKSWLSFGQGTFTPEKHKATRKEWLATRLSGVKTWTKADIAANIDDIDSIVDRNFYKVSGGKQVPILIEKAGEKVKIIDRINKVGLIDVKELGYIK